MQPNFLCRARLSKRWCWLVIALPFGAASVFAQGEPLLTLEQAEEQALGQEPGREALLAEADALREQSVVAGQLPDPQLRLGVGNFPIESGGFTTEGMTQAQVGVRQAFPPGKTRSLGTRQFQERANQLTRSADARARDVTTTVRQAWLDTFYWQQAHMIVSEARPYFSDLVTVTRSLYSVGRRDQHDVLQAELELSRLDERLIDISRELARARARLSEWAPSAATQPVGAGLPAWERLPPLETLVEGLLEHPRLRAAEAAIDARQTGISLAEQQYKPGWAIDLGYGYRDGSLPNGDPRSDFMSVMVTVDVPLFRAKRQDRAVAAARQQRRAASETREQLARELESRLRSEFARWQDLTRQLELYERTIVPQAEDRARAALLAYQSDSGDFDDVMRGQIDVLDLRVVWERLKAERAQSFAVLANLGGLTP
ncbi:MAG: TolC family protein [Pseudomonadota bacterium]